MAFATAARSSSLANSLYMFKIIRWLRRSCFIVLREYVLILFMLEKDRSLAALVAGKTSINRASQHTCL